MCGIAGLLDFKTRTPQDTLIADAIRMAATLHHRGPDEGNAWADAEAGAALGHRRLSIVDLSAAGRQPMASASGRYVIAYNGEIYNAPELRASLPPDHPWRGHSDTEVLLEVIDAWGLEQALSRSVGMFAIALFDRRTRTLSLVRDRLGKKPLYYTRQNGLFLFGSELRALRAHPRFEARICRKALSGYIRRGYYLHPETVYESVYQLEPGHILTVTADGTLANTPYWTLAGQIEAARRAPFTGTPAEAVAALEEILTSAVTSRMVADVPLGAFLSGGIDSSAVAALMQANSSRPVRTFSIGFDDPAYDESPHARAVAEHLGSDHTGFRVSSDEARAVIPQLPDLYDEPFADASQIPTYLVAHLARQSVTVALSGDGGDELFAGYNRYHQGEALRRKARALPAPARRVLAAALLATRPTTLDAASRLIPARHRPPALGEKLHKLARILTLDGRDAYLALTSHWPDPNAIVTGAAANAKTGIEAAALEALLPDPVERMQAYDTLGYLPAGVMTKVDRATMAASLEARAPLLDHRVLDFAWTLPLSLKLRDGSSKWVLRQLLYRHVPQSLIDRPKAGFAIPIGAWLRGPLRDWAEDLLDAKRLADGGFLNPAPIHQAWSDHQAGRTDRSAALWTILMFEAWRRRYEP